MNLADLIARALYSEYRDAGAGSSWHALSEDEKNRWRRVADYTDISALLAGRCGTEAHPPLGPTVFCELLAGHDGWHRVGTTEWGPRHDDA